MMEMLATFALRVVLFFIGIAVILFVLFDIDND